MSGVECRRECRLIRSDGIGVGVMLDVARVLIERNESFDNSVIFRELRFPPLQCD